MSWSNSVDIVVFCLFQVHLQTAQSKYELLVQEKQYLEAKLISQKAQLETEHQQQSANLQVTLDEKSASIDRLQSELLSNKAQCESLERSVVSLERNAESIQVQLRESRDAVTHIQNKLNTAQQEISVLTVTQL